MSAKRTARLFVALSPPPNVRALLFAAAQKAQETIGFGGRITTASNLHLTIFFAGETARDKIDAIDCNLAAVCADSAALQFIDAQMRWMPNPAAPSMLWLRFAANPEFESLRRACAAVFGRSALSQTLQTAQIPHITLARMRRSETKSGFSKDDLPRAPLSFFAARRLVLIESILAPAGARYRVLSARDLPSAR